MKKSEFLKCVDDVVDGVLSEIEGWRELRADEYGLGKGAAALLIRQRIRKRLDALALARST